jgi:hypothetical protein
LWTVFRCAFGLQLFELQLQLLDLLRDLLRLASELHALELGNEQLQMLELTIAREQLLMLSKDNRSQCINVKRVQIRQ